ncbi:hypothetical protein [Sphingobacterium sp. LRF_L2]|uniref:hypothetical protein n=1 Tax=Sphingobacterium sp. LRF_L2 TaxID=3369421 RepID=UPI003F6205BD
MLTFFIYYTIISFCCSVIGHVVSTILLYEDVLNWYGKILERLPKMIAQPLGLCVLCFSGQLALWSSFVFSLYHGGGWFIPYSICGAIFLVAKYK